MTMMPCDVVTAQAEYSVWPSEVEVVEDLHRLGVPCRTLGRTGRAWSGGRRAPRWRGRRRNRGVACRVEHAGPFLSGRLLRGGDMRFDRPVRRLSDCRGRTKSDRQCRATTLPTENVLMVDLLWGESYNR